MRVVTDRAHTLRRGAGIRWKDAGGGAVGIAQGDVVERRRGGLPGADAEDRQDEQRAQGRDQQAANASRAAEADADHRTPFGYAETQRGGSLLGPAQPS